MKAGYGIRQPHAYAGMVSESRNLKKIPAGITFLLLNKALAFFLERISALQSRVSSQRVEMCRRTGASCTMRDRDGNAHLGGMEGWDKKLGRDAGLKKTMLEEVEICLLHTGNENYRKLFILPGAFVDPREILSSLALACMLWSEGFVYGSVGCEYFPCSIHYTVPMFGLKKCFRSFYA